MMNFLLGAVAGGLIACVATITAVRHPEMQARLGLKTPVVVLPAPAPPRPETVCPPPAPKVGSPEMLFSPRRFWSIAP